MKKEIPSDTPTDNTVSSDIQFIHLLRAIAISMVVYAHFVGQSIGMNNAAWRPKLWIETYLLQPFGIIQSFGFAGVALFFLVSGYIITHVASTENRREFAIKRIWRIYPPLIVSVLICVLVMKLNGAPLPSWSDIFLNFTLFNYLLVPQVVIQGVAWSLVIEVTFYVLTFIFLNLLKRYPLAHLLVQSFLVAIVLIKCRAFGGNFFLFAVGFSYLPFLLSGQAFYFWQNKRLSLFWCVVIILLQFALIQWGIRSIQPQFLEVANSYLINFVFMLGLFLLLAQADIPRLHFIPKRLAEMSYSLYLLHGNIGIFILTVLGQHMPYFVALLMSIAATLLIAQLSLMLVEKPSQKFARYLKNIKKVS
ncbi:MAG: acyltransferase [Undibacterium sp.]|nr:acyltransferase [Undibacterium sp.]